MGRTHRRRQRGAWVSDWGVEMTLERYMTLMIALFCGSLVGSLPLKSSEPMQAEPQWISSLGQWKSTLWIYIFRGLAFTRLAWYPNPNALILSFSQEDVRLRFWKSSQLKLGNHLSKHISRTTNVDRVAVTVECRAEAVRGRNSGALLILTSTWRRRNDEGWARYGNC